VPVCRLRCRDLRRYALAALQLIHLTLDAAPAFCDPRDLLLEGSKYVHFKETRCSIGMESSTRKKKASAMVCAT
jgi:hypothetical protein